MSGHTGLRGLSGPTRCLAGVAATMMSLLVLGGQLALAEHYARAAEGGGRLAAAPGAQANSAAAATLAGCRVVKPASLERPVS
ncbi:MAG TPA: hypothetical protein VMV91_12445 [Rhodocyclaceae bacterium]|nr:hypothetical protein [Rhodocyclaceae bacterium]